MFLKSRATKVGWILLLLLTLTCLTAAHWTHFRIPFSLGWGAENSHVTTRQRGLPLVASPAQMDFGTLAKGGRYECQFSLHNPGDVSIEISDIRTSCDCYHVALETYTIAPGDKTLATATVDFAKDPTAAGRFRLEAMGLLKTVGVPQNGGVNAKPAFVVYGDLIVQ